MFNIKKRAMKTMSLICAWLFFARASFAEGQYGITPQDPATLSKKIVDIVQQIGMPIGGAILFLSVCLVAVDMMLYKFNPDKRSSAMNGLLWVGGGGFLLGAALFIAGVIIGTGNKFAGQ